METSSKLKNPELRKINKSKSFWSYATLFSLSTISYGITNNVMSNRTQDIYLTSAILLLLICSWIWESEKNRYQKLYVIEYPGKTGTRYSFTGWWWIITSVLAFLVFVADWFFQTHYMRVIDGFFLYVTFLGFFLYVMYQDGKNVRKRHELEQQEARNSRIVDMLIKTT